MNIKFIEIVGKLDLYPAIASVYDLPALDMVTKALLTKDFSELFSREGNHFVLLIESWGTTFRLENGLKVVVSMSDEHDLVRIENLPFMKEAELKKFVKNAESLYADGALIYYSQNGHTIEQIFGLTKDLRKQLFKK